MAKFKKIFLILMLTGFCFLVFSNSVLAQKTEEIYPDVAGAETPTTTKALLPEYIKYLFNLAIIIAGLIAFASLVYGGFRYVASAGNPAAMSDARSQITAGILGLILLLAAYVLLIQINPELIILKIGKAEFDKGIILFAAGQPCGSNTAGMEEGKNYLRVRSNYSSLGDFNNKAAEVYFYDSGEEMEVQIFPEENYGGTAWISADHVAGGPCKSLAGVNSKSVRLIWKIPGVYLFSDTECKNDPKLFTSSISDFGGFINFDNKAKSIKIIPRRQQISDELVWDPTIPGCAMGPVLCDVTPQCCEKEKVVVDKLGAVLHEHNDFKGDAEVFFGGAIDQWPPKCIPLEGGGPGPQCDQTMDTSYCYEHVNEHPGGTNPRASSITVFAQRPPDAPQPTGGVTLYANYNFNLDDDNPDDPNNKCGPYHPTLTPQWIDKGICSVLNNKTSSITIEGNYIAVLFRDEGRGEVFTHSDIRLKDNHIGDNASRFLLVIPVIKKGG